ncbi:hypothetical protein BDQ94DRAFT_154207 [Aspergillus welwitschiae]|uniref:Uncharacterized protein n=1 Tax=Aspergillus welwitschiae TaxID=1341132 RepID=A0A3F3PK27_9EURO|nr:hypothetical protein BDQ94DRAFT_154207 [Aspergillus welwitschiae]RDH27299.1 hypothetical protein BDQ94DRAFT_154207 [Aspergillus welwitschiae]
MRQPSETWANPQYGDREPGGSETGQIIRQDYRSSSRCEFYYSVSRVVLCSADAVFPACAC